MIFSPFICHGPLPLVHPFLHSSMTLIQPLCPPSPPPPHCNLFFTVFPSCRHLDLSNNSLTTLPRKTLQTAPLLESLVLQANPWSCDCRMNWFLPWSLAHPGDYHACSIIFFLLMFCLPHTVH